MRETSTHITIVFDNYTYVEGSSALWGFSAFVQSDDYTLLFDTGSNGRVLLQNMLRFGTDLKEAKGLFLSHPHWDHIGGVDSVLEVHPDLRLFIPSSFSEHLIRDLRHQAKAVTVVDETPQKFLPAFYSTGTMGEIGEHAAIFDTDRGVVVITGCAHPGCVNVARRAMQITGKEIALLIGGFHLLHYEARAITEVMRELDGMNVHYLCPSHCSGNLAIEMFRRYFGERFLEGGVGRVLEL